MGSRPNGYPANGNANAKVRGNSPTMEDNSREQLEKKIEQSRRLAAEPIDDLSKERLKKLIEDLEGQLLGLK
jgi:hypothetical protein